MNKNSDINKKFRIIKVVLIVAVMALLVKLGIVAVYFNDDFSDMANYQTSVVIEQELPRGEIYDVNDHLIVGNEAQKNLNYVEAGIKTQDELYANAAQVAAIIDVDTEMLTTSDIKDLWLQKASEDGQLNYNIAMERLSKEEQDKYNDYEKEENQTALNELMRDQVTDEEVNEMITTYGKETMYIKILMSQATAKNPVVIKEDLTLDEQYAMESRYGEIGSFYVADSYERKYPYDNTLKSFLGKTGPIPADDMSEYEAKGYSVSEEVGISYLEKELESLLHAKPQKYNVYFDEAGNIVNSEQISEGHVAHDVKLTIDIEYQQEVDKIMKDQLETNDYQYNTNALTIINNPQTGDLIAISGINEYTNPEDEDDVTYYDNSVENFMNAYVLGSVVKPAVLLMGYDQGVWEYDQEVMDETLTFSNMPPKGSFVDYGLIDETFAIQHSSNVYFYTIFMEIVGIEYEDNMEFDVDPMYFDLVRKYYATWGLGVETGLDMPETSGFIGKESQPGKYLDLANGQYDMYSNVQFSQYAATVANEGTRYKVNYLDSVYNAGKPDEMGTLVYQNDPKILNTIPNPDEDFEQLQEGMELCSEYGGSGYSDGYKDLSVPSACKTGTAQTFAWDAEKEESIAVDNSTLMAYAPRENPTFAMTMVLPYTNPDGVLDQKKAGYYAKTVQDTYFEMYPEKGE